MPDSPVPVDAAIVSSPGHPHISTTTTQHVDGRPSISVVTGVPNGIHAPSPSQPISPGILNNNLQLPPTCGARQLGKLKRFLTTLQQFGSDISPDIGEMVRKLIVSLVNNVITVEEFHQQLQDATNFPLRPFVIPFLKANLPLLQQELLQCSQLYKHSPLHYITSSGESLPDRQRDHIKTEVEEFNFERTGDKRKSDMNIDRPKENGLHLEGVSPNKRRIPSYEGEGGAFVDQLVENIKHDTDEWRSLETMLQCVVTFVEKAKASMRVLQERCLRDREEMASWARAMAADADNEIIRRAESMIEKRTRNTDEMKRRAEEAVNDVKRQAVVELQKAVSAAEEKANEALNQAHLRMDQAVSDARRQAKEETTLLMNHQEHSKETCWNCGRKANETCSGCSVARYCGSFCQHKDWENHHKECAKYAKQHQESLAGSKSKSPSQIADLPDFGKSTPEHKSPPTVADTDLTDSNNIPSCNVDNESMISQQQPLDSS